MARTCILRAFGLQMRCHGVFLWCYTFVLFCFVFVFMFSLKEPWPFVQSFFDIQAPRQPHVFLPLSLLFLRRCRFFRVFHHCVWRVRRTFFPSGWCFFYLACTTGWISASPYYYVRIQSIQSINNERLLSDLSFRPYATKQQTFKRLLS